MDRIFSEEDKAIVISSICITEMVSANAQEKGGESHI